MPRKSISDNEIALIKAMLSRGMKNRDIQFFFNRPDRPVNSGRITGIASGKYGDADKIPRASESDLNAFLASRTPTTQVPLVGSSEEEEQSSPLAESTLKSMFSQEKGGTWRLTAGETDTAECKTSFGMKHPAAWLRAVAALANNRGGYVFFGVGNKDEEGVHHPVKGLYNTDFLDIDPAEIVKRLRSTFEPTPRFQRTTIEIGSLRVGVLYVEQHASRPVIALKAEGGGDIKEGDIFFRYADQSTRINYADLRALLDARDAQARADILPMVQRLIEIGPSRAMVADLADGSLMDGRKVIEFDEGLVARLKFIKEGEFDERSGAPTLRLIGDVKTTTAAEVSTSPKKGLVTRPDMHRDFLAEKLTADAIDYVRCALEVSGNDWLPIRYFGRAAGLSAQQLLKHVETTSTALPAQRRLYAGRLANPDAAFSEAKGPQAPLLRQVLAGQGVPPRNLKEARQLALALQGLPRPLTVEVSVIRELLKKCAELVASSEDGFAKSALRKAVARLDELIPV